MASLSRSARFTERTPALFEYAMVVALVGACVVAILGLMSGPGKDSYRETGAALARPVASHDRGSGRALASPGFDAAHAESPADTLDSTEAPPPR